MIVTIAAWLYIADAALMLLVLLWSPMGFNGAEDLLALAFAALFGAMGVGLLKRLPWARWLALGSSLLGWTLGSVLLILSLGYLFLAAPAGAYIALLFGAGPFSILAIIMAFALLLGVVAVIISYKLFWYLCSETGCAEFGVPHDSKQTVIASCGAWVVIGIVNIMVSDGGQSMYQLANLGGDDADAVRQVELQLQREQAEELARQENEYAARRARSEAMLRAQAEAEQVAAAGGPTETVIDDGANGEAIMADEAPAPMPAPMQEQTSEAPAEVAPEPLPEEEEDSGSQGSKRILKCVDASGANIFTQGYCPPGSKQVRMPTAP